MSAFKALKLTAFKPSVVTLALLKIQGGLSYSLYAPLLPLLPVILRQGKSVKANTIRLPEASGPRDSEGTNLAAANSTSALHSKLSLNLTTSINKKSLLHVGESTVAGVGVVDFQQGLTAHVIRYLTAADSSWAWQAMGQNGATIAELNKQLKTKVLKNDPSVILLTMGVNDTTAMTRRGSWVKNLKYCIDTIEQRRLNIESQGAPVNVCFTQVPPMHLFPALPFPLNLFLGLRAWQLDNSLRQLCVQQDWTHLKIEMPLEKEWMATDGYHPNAEGYKRWAEKIAALLRP